MILLQLRPAKRHLVIHGRDVVQYGPNSDSMPCIRRAQACLVRAPSHKSVILPGDYLELDTPVPGELHNTVWALEPRLDSTNNKSAQICTAWPPPQEIESIGSTLRITDTTTEPIVVKRSEHLCQVRPVVSEVQDNSSVATCLPPPSSQSTPYSATVSLMSYDQKNQFHILHAEFDSVFNPEISLYNSESGPIEAHVNIGPV